MAFRTDKDAVHNILGPHYGLVNGALLNVLPFIESANGLVDRVVVKDTGSLMSASDLELVERWLSAHLYAHADQLYQNKSQGGASGGFQGQTGMYFSSTQYGQTALMLDYTGTLADLEKQAKEGKKTAGFIWLGTRMHHDESETAGDQ